MRSRLIIIASFAALAAVVLIVGVAVAGPTQSDPLPAVTASDLISRMGQAEGDVTAISGEVSWQNGLFGDTGDVAGMAQLPAQSPLTAGGSGRIWVSDAGARAESQGSGGDQVVVLSKAARTAWVYDYAQNTVRKYVVTGEAPAETPSPAPSATFMTPEAITLYLQQFARFATVEVAGQAEVAGRGTYLLTMTPVAEDTALGAVRAAIDGETMVPLRLEVFAKGGTTPVLRFGFDSVSYDPVDASLFAFIPPEGATVKAKTIDGDAVRDKAGAAHDERAAGGAPSGADKAAREQVVRRALLTRAEVQDLVPYELASARGYEARPFRWGYVLAEAGPLTAGGAPLMQLMGAATGMDHTGLVTTGSPSTRDGSPAAGPSSVLLYGDGFGAIALAQTKTTPELDKQLKQLGQTSQLLDKVTIGDATAQVVGTPLGGIVVWQQGGTTLLAAGMVPMDDLKAFAGSVR